MEILSAPRSVMHEISPSQKESPSMALTRLREHWEAPSEMERDMEEHIHKLHEEMLYVLSGLFGFLDRGDEEQFCAALPEYLKMSFADADHLAPPTFDEFDCWDDARMLSVACSQGLPRAAEILLQAGARAFNEREKTSPLFAAACSCSPKARECIEILLANGSTVFQISASGESALHVAAASGRVDLCLLLLEKGADYACHNAIGQTPWERAIGCVQLDTAAAIHAWVEASEISASLPSPAYPSPARRI